MPTARRGVAKTLTGVWLLRDMSPNVPDAEASRQSEQRIQELQAQVAASFSEA